MRVEALPDPSLPCHGPGRSPDDGNFILEAVHLEHDPWARGSRPPGSACPGRLRTIRDRSRGLRGVAAVLEAIPTPAWAIWPQVGRAHWAVFQIAEPFGTGPGTRLRVELVFGRTKSLHSTLGRFRLSVTNRQVPSFEPSLMRLKASRERHGLTRLGAAYCLLGDWASAASTLERTAARPNAPALDGFLLALARHHLGRSEAARRDCDRALKRLGTDVASEETRDVAIAALTTIRGLSVDEAELLLLDTTFPADPFAP